MSIKIMCTIHGDVKWENTRVYKNKRNNTEYLRCKFCDNDFEDKRKLDKRRIIKRESFNAEVAAIENMPHITYAQVENKRIQLKLNKMFLKYNRSK